MRIAVAVCVVLSAAILLKRFTGSDRDEARRAERLAGAVTERSTAAGGWTARESDEGEPAAGSGAAFRSDDPSRGDASGADPTGVGAGGATVLGGQAGRRAGAMGTGAKSSVGSAGSLAVDSTAGNSNRGTVADVLARERREARERLAQPSREVAAVDAQAAEQKPDPDNPVFSTFKDGRLDSDTGVLPLVAEKVESKDGQVIFGKDSQYAAPDAGNVQGQAGAISFWVKPEWGGSDKEDAHMVDLQTPNVWENRLAINKNGRYLRFMFFPNTGVETGVSTIIDNWQPQQAHHVVAVWGPQDEGGNVLQFYVDGRQVGSEHYDGEFEVPQTQPLIIGNNRHGELGARGGISAFEVYNARIDADKVRSLYDGGLQ